jgi:hypothetical protein
MLRRRQKMRGGGAHQKLRLGVALPVTCAAPGGVTCRARRPLLV